VYLSDAMAALYGYGAVMVALLEVGDPRRQGPTLDWPLCRSAVFRCWARSRHPQAHRQVTVRTCALDQFITAQRLPDQGRPLGLPFGLTQGMA